MKKLTCFTLSTLLLFGLAGCSKASRTARHLERGERDYVAGQYEKAEIEYLNALRLEPKNVMAIRRLGSIYLDQARLERAFKFLQAARQLAPDNTEVRFKLAVVMYNVGDGAKAREELLAVLSKDATNSDAIVLLAETVATPTDAKQVRDRLSSLRQGTGDKAAFHAAEGLLALRNNETNRGEAEFKQAIALDPKLASAHDTLGMLAWRRGDLTNAGISLKTAADLSPVMSPRRVRLAEFKAGTGAVAEARTLLEEMVKAMPTHLLAWKVLADLQLQAKEFDACAKSLAHVRSVEPTDYQAGQIVARLKLAQGKASEAIEEYERLHVQAPRSANLLYQTAIAYLANKDLANAVSRLEQAVTLSTNFFQAELLLADLKTTRQGDPTTAIALLTDVIKKRPGDEQAYYLLANAYRVRGTLEEALSVYRGLIQAFPKNPRAPYLTGLILRQQKKPAEARQAFEKTIEIDPNFVPPLSQLVDLDIAENSHSGALQRIRDAMRRNPKVAELPFLEAKVRLAQKQPGEAEKALRRSLELDPNYRDAYVALAQISIQSGKIDAALIDLNKTIEKNPNDVVALIMTALLQEGQGNFDKARETYEKLLEFNPKSGLALNNLAYLYAIRLHQTNKGLDLARRARELLPNDPAVADTLGWILYLRKDYADALPLLQQSAEMLPNEPEARYHLGMAHYMMGHEEPARAALEAAIQDNKGFLGKDEARQKLIILGAETGKPTPEIIQSLEKSIVQNPTDVTILLRLASLYEQNGLLEKAQDVSEKALKVNPKAVRAMLVLARVHGARPDGAQRALDYAKNARAAAPEDAEVAHAAGRAAFQAGQHDWSYSILQESNRKQSGNPEVLFDLAWAAYSVGKVKEAEDAMQNALRSGTNFSRAEPARRFLDMVTLTRNPASIPQATATIQEALKGDPHYTPALMANALASEQRGDYEAAKKAYEQVLQRFAQFLPATRNLAIIYANHLNDPQKGYELAAKARRALPDDVELAKTLGKLAYQRGEYQYAAQLLKEVEQKKAADAEVYYYLGMSQYRLKQKPESTNNLQQALKLNLEAKLGDEAKRVLTELK